MAALFFTTPVTTFFALRVLNVIGLTGIPLIFMSGLVQVALGALFAHIAGRDPEKGAAWGGGSFLVWSVGVYVLIVLFAPDFTS